MSKEIKDSDMAQPAEEQGKKVPLLNKWLLLFMAAMILANIGGNMYGSLLPLYLQDLNASVAQVGLFFTIASIVPLLLQILGGWISDSLGRLRSIAWGSIAGAVSYVVVLLSPTWGWVLLGEGLGAITRSLVGPSFDAFIAEQSDEKNRARVFGITQALFMIVSVVGPLLGGWLADDYGFKRMLFVAAVFYFMATIIRVAMARIAASGREANPQKLTFTSLKSNLSTMFGMVFAGGLITWILVTDGARDTSFALSMNLMPIYMGDIANLSLKQIGLMNSIFGLFMMLFTIPGGWLADKKGERVGIALGFLLVFISFPLFLIDDATVWMFGLSWAVAGTGVGLLSPAYSSLISKAVPEKLRGTAFGLFSTSLGLISLPAPAIGALLWENVGPKFPFQITAGVILLSIIPVWLKFKLPKDEQITTGAGSGTNGHTKA
jgi:MFS family permease